jgi:hypothetical protein
MALVFLSYTHRDTDLADRLRVGVEAAGQRIWRDDLASKVATMIPEGVASGLTLCDNFAALPTGNPLQSQWMGTE